MGEAELIKAAAAGDTDAFERLVDLKRRLVLRAAFRILGNLDDAHDVAQTVFLTLWRSLDRYDHTRRFDTWLYKVTVNAAIDMSRKAGPRGVLQPLTDASRDRLFVTGPDAEGQLNRAELQKVFLRLSAALPERQRAAFVLRELQGLSTAQVAEALDVTESTVRNHLLQARRVLREGIRREYPGLVPSGDSGEGS
ncbi:MAG: RNA polymerase sigma factor [Acidobacteria bacterium]|uniref:RNA polymerase sigma factor n=1 Tax=Candidatus Polarisedimenticola svalbardensis TaxID=2886004 RepID=A0A8J7C211_9BACT|nr:RNA polymerase sigma factor [Candidatus Polarisedimenticola svalbardensis]